MTTKKELNRLKNEIARKTKLLHRKEREYWADPDYFKPQKLLRHEKLSVRDLELL